MRVQIITGILLCGCLWGQTDLDHYLSKWSQYAEQVDEYYSGTGDNDSDLVTTEYKYDLVDVDELEVRFDYGFGSLDIKPGKKNQIIGEIEYNPHEFTPSVSYDTYGNKGVFKVKIKSNRSDERKRERSRSRTDDEKDYDYDYDYDYDSDEGSKNYRFDFDFNKDDLQQEFDFRLPPAIPMDLQMEFGLGEANIDLTGLEISNLDIECGLSDVKLNVDKTNPIKCKEMYIESGLGDFNGDGLGFLRSKYINIEVSLGATYVDLRDQTTDLTGDISVGLGSLELVLPENANIKVRVDDSFLSSIDLDDLEKTGHKEWSSKSWKSRQPTIDLDITIGLGSVDVDLE